MLKILSVIAVLALVPTASARPAARDAKTSQPPIRIIVTGDIQSLGITRAGNTRIAIGRIGCEIPAKLAARAGRFVIGDPVRIVCSKGLLTSIEYTPSQAAGRTAKTASHSQVSASSSDQPPSSGGSGCTEHYLPDANGTPKLVLITCTTRVN